MLMSNQNTPKKQLRLNAEVITQLNTTPPAQDARGWSFLLCSVLCGSAVCSIIC